MNEIELRTLERIAVALETLAFPTDSSSGLPIPIAQLRNAINEVGENTGDIERRLASIDEMLDSAPLIAIADNIGRISETLGGKILSVDVSGVGE